MTLIMCCIKVYHMAHWLCAHLFFILGWDFFLHSGCLCASEASKPSMIPCFYRPWQDTLGTSLYKFIFPGIIASLFSMSIHCPCAIVVRIAMHLW